MPRKLPIFYNAILLTGVNLLLRFVSTSFQVFLSRRIGPAGIGLLQLVLSVGGLCTTAGMAGIRTATMYLTAGELGRKHPENIHWVLSACCLFSILCSGAVSTLLYSFAPQIAKYWIGNESTTEAIRLYACIIPVICLCGVMTGYFTAANRIGTLAAVEVAEQLLCLVSTMLILSFWAGSDPARACQSVIIGSGAGACLTLVCLTFLRLRGRTPAGPRIPVRKRLLDTAVPLALADDLKAGISTTENLMVPKRLGLYAVGEDPLSAFGTVCGMVFPVLMFPAAILFSLAELIIPELARCNAAGSTRRIRYLVKRGLKVALLYGCFFCGLELLLAEELCIALYGSSDAGKQLQLYALLIPMLYCDALIDAMTKGLGQQKACVRYNIVTSSMDVALLYILLPKYGMAGYYFSFLVTHLLNFLLSLGRLTKISGCSISVPVVCYTLTATAIAVAASSLLTEPVLKVPSFLLIAAALMFLMKVIKKEDLLWLKGLIQTSKSKNAAL